MRLALGGPYRGKGKDGGGGGGFPLIFHDILSKFRQKKVIFGDRAQQKRSSIHMTA